MSSDSKNATVLRIGASRSLGYTTAAGSPRQTRKQVLTAGSARDALLARSG
jgi:hypothetical protein